MSAPVVRPALAMALLLLAGSVLAITPNAEGSHFSTGIVGPDEGTEFEVQGPSDTWSFLVTRGETILGYNEWYDYVLVENLATNEGIAIDRHTNHLLGTIGQFASTTTMQPTVPREEVPDGPVVSTTQTRLVSFNANIDPWVATPDMPERFLWGTDSALDGQVIDITAVAGGFENTPTTLTIERIRSAEKVITAWVNTTHTYGPTQRNMVSWRLVFEAQETDDWFDLFGPFAQERVRTASFEYRNDPDNATWHRIEGEPEAYTLTIVTEGEYSLGFDGRIDRLPFPDRDRRYTYAPAGIYPPSTGEDPYIDVAQAGQAALAHDDPAIGSFLARSDDYVLTSLWVYLDAPRVFGFGVHEDAFRQVWWHLDFADADGNNLWVDLSGKKFPHGELLVDEVHASWYQDEWSSAPSRDQMAATEFAPIDALARSAQATVDNRYDGTRLIGFSYSAYGDWDPVDGAPVISASVSAYLFHDSFLDADDSVDVDIDPRTGIVRWSSMWIEQRDIAGIGSI